jgi:hypothetical protein
MNNILIWNINKPRDRIENVVRFKIFNTGNRQRNNYKEFYVYIYIYMTLDANSLL